MYYDIHAHFAEEGYELSEELPRILSAGVEKVVLASDSVLHSQMHGLLSQVFLPLYFTAGIHPSESGEYSPEAVEKLRNLLDWDKCVAVGEIGLDYHYENTDKNKQWEAFKGQILLADEKGLPVQIHSRDALADTLAILKEMRGYLKHGLLLHCYSYGVEAVKEFLALGAYFSFGGVACFKNARRVVESIQAIPVDRLLSETDSPYLSPYRGEKNTPANIPVIVKKMAEIKGEREAQLSAQMIFNAHTLFPKLR